MKSTLVILLICCFVLGMKSQIVNFPDVNFKNKVIADGVDTNQDGEIQVSEAEAVVELNVLSLANDPNKITNMEGIQYFVNLERLQCSGNLISNLDVTSNTNLRRLLAYSNELTSLNVTNLVLLEQLWISQNQLEEIDINSLTNLWWIYCIGNLLTELNVDNLANLEAIWAGDNLISSINLQNNPLLNYVLLDNNLLTEIDISPLTNLEILDLSYNSLSSIDLDNLSNLRELYLRSTTLENIDCSLSGVTILHCDNSPNLNNINVQNGLSDFPDPDLLFFPLSLYNLPNLESICMDPGDWSALHESGYDSANVTVFTGANCTLSVEEYDLAKSYLYPNPVKDYLKIVSNADIASFRLFDIFGNSIAKRDEFEDLSQVIYSLTPGIYFLQLETDTKQSTVLKFIKE